MIVAKAPACGKGDSNKHMWEADVNLSRVAEWPCVLLDPAYQVKGMVWPWLG